MKNLVVVCVALLAVICLLTCSPGPRESTGRNVVAGEPAGGLSAAPVATGEPARERYYRSYPAPTGAPGFRRYYQMRCYPGCHTGATPAVPPEAATPVATLEQASTERPYRSYPAPTGAPGFRRYYQIRCYPGCHSYPGATAVATRIHP